METNDAAGQKSPATDGAQTDDTPRIGALRFGETLDVPGVSGQARLVAFHEEGVVIETSGGAARPYFVPRVVAAQWRPNHDERPVLPESEAIPVDD